MSNEETNRGARQPSLATQAALEILGSGAAHLFGGGTDARHRRRFMARAVAHCRRQIAHDTDLGMTGHAQVGLDDNTACTVERHTGRRGERTPERRV